MKKSALKARIRVLESDLARIGASRDQQREDLIRANATLREIGTVLTTITARAIEGDKGQVGGWFAWVMITTPTLIMLSDMAKRTLEANVESFRRRDEAGL